MNAKRAPLAQIQGSGVKFTGPAPLQSLLDPWWRCGSVNLFCIRSSTVYVWIRSGSSVRGGHCCHEVQLQDRHGLSCVAAMLTLAQVSFDVAC